MKQKVIEAITAELSMIASSNKDTDKHIYAIEKLLDVLKEGQFEDVPIHHVEGFERAEQETKDDSKSDSIFDF